jgi:acyl-CoA synthetase (AMP-forming)/AMP-acid ligase II
VNVLSLSRSWFEGGAGQAPISGHPYEFIFDSSGTTGAPKLIRFSKTNMEHRLRLLEDPGFPALPRYYTTTGTARALSVAEFLATLVRGGTIIQPNDRSPSGILDTINLFRPNYVSMAPASLVNILAHLREEPRHIERVDCLRLSGSHCSNELREEALAKLAREVVILFGATEIGKVAQGGTSDLGDEEDSVGRVLPDVEVEVIDDTRAPVPPGTEGEIRVRIPAAGVTSYVTAGGDRSPLRDGWFYPGDTGRITEDGTLAVTGRTSLLINVGGNKISPERAEKLLRKLDGVEDVAVLGVKDDSGFDIVCALVVNGRDLTLGNVNDFLRARRATFMVSKLKLVPAIPRLPAGKVDRERLHELAA